MSDPWEESQPGAAINWSSLTSGWEDERLDRDEENERTGIGGETLSSELDVPS